jgi:Transposase IS116/IS110/IS902 family
LAAIGDIGRFKSPGRLVSYFGLNPRVRQSGLGAAHHGRISKVGRSHARAMLVEAAWAAAKAPGPLHAFFVRIRAKRGHQIAAVALARKLTVLCWHLLTKDQDYLWARPALIANKTRAMELQAGKPQKKGNQRGPAYAYNVKTLRDQEMRIAEQGERNYARFVERWKVRPGKNDVRERPQSCKDRVSCLAALAADTPRFATRSPAPAKHTTRLEKTLVNLIRRVDDPAHRLWECKERDDPLPVAPPALSDRRIFLPPMAGVKCRERCVGRGGERDHAAASYAGSQSRYFPEDARDV